MKNLNTLLVLVLVTSFFFSSCRNEDDALTAKGKIVGKWRLTKEVDTEHHNNSKVDQDVFTDFSSASYLEFKSDNTVTLMEDGHVETASYSMNDAGTKITFTYDEMETDIVDITLSSSDLVIKTEETDVDGNITYEYVYESFYKKQ